MSLDDALAFMKAGGIRGRVTNAVMVQHALERGIPVSADAKGRVRLRQDGLSWLFHNGWTNLNVPLAVRCARQKEVASRLLLARGVPAVENAYFGPGDLKRAWAWAEPVLPVVVKPSDKSHGLGVHVEITDRDRFEAAFTSVCEEFGGTLVEIFVRGVEHRVTTVDGEVVAAARRVPAHVVGNGQETIAELVATKNRSRGPRQSPIHKRLQMDDLATAELGKQGLTADSVPTDGRQVFLRATSNISTGGDAVDATDELLREEADVVRRAATAIPGVRLAGFDVMLPRAAQHEEIRIVEVNLAPMISMHHYPWVGRPRNVAVRVLEAMFPRLVR